MIRMLMILIFTCACFKTQAQVNIITTIAGTDSAGFSGDEGAAINAKLNFPSQLCLDQSGNIYIADAFNHRIRKINSATGIITTVAGTGVPGYSSDNILATNTELLVPEGIAIDNYGNIYIADAGNRRIRKVDGITGIITTICGTGVIGNSGDGDQAINAEMDAPSGLCLDKYSNLFFADFHNNNIRKVDISTGVITTVVGTGISGYFGDNGPATDAQISGPFDVFVDSSGNIFFTDSWNSVIRKVDFSTGIIMTIAGNGTAGYSGDNGNAIDAKLWEPTGIFVDGGNNIFISEYKNGTVRKITGSAVTSSGEITGTITTEAGIGVPGFSGDNGPATNAQLHPDDVFIDPHGNMFIADYVNNRIRKVNNALKVNELKKEDILALYPNPTKGKFVVQTTGGKSEIVVCNIAGEQVYQIASETKEIPVDISNLPQGVYLVYVQSGDDKYVSKVIKE